MVNVPLHQMIVHLRNTIINKGGGKISKQLSPKIQCNNRAIGTESEGRVLKMINLWTLKIQPSLPVLLI